MFISKKAILENFLVDDYHNVQVNFNRYDMLSSSKDPNRKIKEHQKVGVVVQTTQMLSTLNKIVEYLNSIAKEILVHNTICQSTAMR